MAPRRHRSYRPLEMRLLRQLSRLDSRVVDTAFAGALCAIALLEVWSGGAGSPALRTVVALLMTLPLALRRRFPLPVLLLVMGAALAQSAADPQADVAGVLIVAIIAAAYSVAAYSDVPGAAVGGVAGLAALWASVHLEGGGVGNYIFAGAVFAGAWLAGLILRSRHLRAQALEERTAILEREQESRAQAAVAEERARIARDLHDAVAHSMSVIAVQAGAERLALPEEAASTREVLRSIEETSRQALVEMRRLVEMLRRDDEELALAPQPSLEHLELLVDQVREAGLPVDLHIEGEPRALPPGVDLSAYRIVQEALTNALKHAGPARALVTVRYAPSELQLEVADDGTGSTSRPEGGGHGLVGMRERVAVFGGVLEAASRVEGGFRLRATLPLGPVTR
jgi:signal transduction histidine kinase